MPHPQPLAEGGEPHHVVRLPRREARRCGENAHHSVGPQLIDGALHGRQVRAHPVAVHSVWHHYELQPGRGDALDARLLVHAGPQHEACAGGAVAPERLQRENQGHPRGEGQHHRRAAPPQAGLPQGVPSQQVGELGKQGGPASLGLLGRDVSAPPHAVGQAEVPPGHRRGEHAPLPLSHAREPHEGGVVQQRRLPHEGLDLLWRPARPRQRPAAQQRPQAPPATPGARTRRLAHRAGPHQRPRELELPRAPGPPAPPGPLAPPRHGPPPKRRVSHALFGEGGGRAMGDDGFVRKLQS